MEKKRPVYGKVILRISCDLELMNYLEQFELNSISIKLNSGLNQSFYVSLAFPDLAATLERGKERA